MLLALDTSILIAGLLEWHEAHARAFPALEDALAGPEKAVLPVHALFEAYSVLTRLPAPRRLRPEAARSLLRESLHDGTRLVGLEADAWSILENLSEREISGGTAYDGLILASARRGGADGILTLNGRHFRRLVDKDFEILEP